MPEPQILTRFLGTDEISIDREKRTLTFPFSSTRPVERWGWFDVDGEEILGRYDEVISHLPSHWDLERVKEKVCPFLKNHNRNTKLGIVQSVKFDSDRAFASVKLRRTKDADEFLDDLENGTAGGVSFGYLPKKYRVISPAEYEGKGWDRRVVKKAVLEAIETELYEVSNEEIPADPSVGFGKTAAISLKSVEIVGEANFERGADKMPGENEDLNLIKRENEGLRSQIESLTKENAGLKDQIKGLTFKTEITGSYNAIRQRAEQLVREAKLSKAEFDAEFTTNSETHLRSILAMEESEARFELRHLERYLDATEKRAPLLPTSLKTDSEPLPKTDAQQDKENQEDADTYAKQFAEKAALPSWKTYRPVA